MYLTLLPPFVSVASACPSTLASVVVLSGTDKKYFSLPFLFGLVGWIFAKLTGQKWIYFWSCGYEIETRVIF
jgi:hypothetical protein